MALVRTYLSRGETHFGSTVLTGLSVTAGDLIVVFGACLRYGTPGTLAIASTNMGIAAWTKVGVDGGQEGGALFYAVVVSTTAAGTVTISDGGSYEGTFAEAHKFTGHDGVRTSISGSGDIGTGPLSMTLPTAPVSTDLTFAATSRRSVSSGGETVTPGASLVEIYDHFTTWGGNYHVVSTDDRTGSTSTAISWTYSGDDLLSVGAAIVVKESTTSTIPIFDHHYRMRRS